MPPVTDLRHPYALRHLHHLFRRLLRDRARAGDRRPEDACRVASRRRSSALRSAGSSPTRSIWLIAAHDASALPAVQRRRVAAAGRLGAGARLSGGAVLSAAHADRRRAAADRARPHRRLAAGPAPSRSRRANRSTSGAMFHGSMLLFGTVAVCIGFLAGVMYLVQSYALKHVRSPANALAAAQPRMAGTRQQPLARPVGRADRARLRLRARHEPRRASRRGGVRVCGPTRSCSAWPPCCSGSSPPKSFASSTRPPAAAAKSPTSRSHRSSSW